jgi:hypothetical protein
MLHRRAEIPVALQHQAPMRLLLHPARVSSKVMRATGHTIAQHKDV